MIQHWSDNLENIQSQAEKDRDELQHEKDELERVELSRREEIARAEETTT